MWKLWGVTEICSTSFTGVISATTSSSFGSSIFILEFLLDYLSSAGYATDFLLDFEDCEASFSCFFCAESSFLDASFGGMTAAAFVSIGATVGV